MSTHEYFPDGVIALNKELASGYHGALMQKLDNHPSAETEIRLAEIASHCSVVLNGVYGPAQIDELAAILAGRLEVLRELAPTIYVDSSPALLPKKLQ